jgi:glycosyltransferase involved in cell wall biosynthesis
MDREARRSLFSLTPQYQHGVTAEDYEVIVVDNGSTTPFNGGSVSEYGPNFKYYYVHNATKSPARALNIGLSMARSDYLAIMIDGARILTPGVLRYGLLLPDMYDRPCGLTHGFHIGPDFQPRSIMTGYNRDEEDRLLESIEWPKDPYRLFEISSAHDPGDGWFQLIGESNFTFMHRDLIADAGGFDERYVSAAGGLLNLDVQTAAYYVPGSEIVVILGEGTFHQLHGGATSSSPWPAIPAIVEDFFTEFREIRGRDYVLVHERRPTFVGHIPLPAMRFLRQSAGVVTLPELQSLNEGIEWLRGEVALRDRQIEELRRRVADMETPSQNSSAQSEFAANQESPQ